MADFLSSVPTVTFGPNGFIAPAESAIYAGVFADINSAFGSSGSLNQSFVTPQGQLASSETAIIGEVNADFIFYTTQTDPAYATGRMQDAIGRIYFIERDPAKATVVDGLCTGLENTPIPTGALAKAEDGNIYTCTAGGTIPVGGTITLPFACNVLGPITCPAASLSQIYQAIPGWDSITNPFDGVIGQNVETRQAFETRRAASVAQNSVGSLPSVRGAVLGVPDVLDAYVTENDTDSPVTIGGFTLAAHSLYVAAFGGDSVAIATAIWTKKAPGCAYNGNTTETIPDNNSGYNPPVPTYDVTFERPAALPILFGVNIVSSTTVPSDANTQIQNAIINAFSGGDGGPRASIGNLLLATRFYTPVAVLGPWAQIRSLNVGSANSPVVAFTGSCATTNLTVSAIALGVLAIGQTISDVAGDFPDGTLIVSQTSGSPGSTGVYVISNPATVSSTAMTASLPNADDVAVGIAQVPTVSAANIAVTVT